MSNRLVALVRNRRMGELVYDEKKDLISLHYDVGWVNSDHAFPLSLSPCRS